MHESRAGCDCGELVWVTQIVDLDRQEEIPEAQRALNEELLNDLKKNKG